MERVKTNLTQVNRICLFVAIAMCLWLSVSSFIASTQLRGDAERGSNSNYFNAYRLEVTSQAQRSQIDGLSRQLAFMVWPQERQTLALDLRQRLHSEINQSPFDGYLWRQLSFAQKHAGQNFRERVWTIENARLLNRWSIQENLFLSHHCFLDYSSFKQVSDDFCSQVLADLPRLKSSKQLARRVGVNTARVKAVMDEEGIETYGARK